MMKLYLDENGHRVCFRHKGTEVLVMPFNVPEFDDLRDEITWAETLSNELEGDYLVVSERILSPQGIWIEKGKFTHSAYKQLRNTDEVQEVALFAVRISNVWVDRTRVSGDAAIMDD
jgi:hypothetical protein